MSELHDADNVEVVHEESDVNVSAILRYGLGLFLVAVVVHAFLWWLLGIYEGQHQRAQTQVYPMAAGQQNRLPPAPRLQSNPQQELRELLARQKAVLEGQSPANKDASVTRMPIDAAMKMIVERGLPTREAQK